MKKHKLSMVRLLLLITTMSGSICITSIDNNTKHASAVESSLRVMTYNIRRKGKEKTQERLWHNRLPLVCETIKKTAPDIIGLQEVTIEQMKDLGEHLPDFLLFGEGRGVSWWGMAPNEYNPILYNKKKYTLLSHETFLINTTDSLFGWMPWHVQQTGSLARICTVGKFKINGTNKILYLYNAHFDHVYEKAQILCATTIVQHIARHTKGSPVIVMGDFNTPFSGNIKKVFANFQHAKDGARQCVGPDVTSNGWDNKKWEWIDHILINDPKLIDILKYGVVEHDGNVYPSDHRPVFADIEFKSTICSK